MAGKTFKLSILVDATTKSATKGLGKLGKALGGVATAGAVVGTAVVAAAALAGGAMIKLAIDAAPMEGIEKAFEGIAEASGESADVMLEALQKGSAGMITQRDLMSKYNLAASLVSDTFANELPNAMGYLTKVAAGTGEDMGYMLDSLVRGVGRLSPMILDNLGIQVDLSEAYDAFAPTIGKVAGELTKQEQQTALMNQVMEKLAVNTAAMPEVTGTAATAFAAMGTQIKDLKDGIGLALQPVLLALMNPLNDLAQKYGPQVIEWAKVAGEWLGKKIPIAIETVTGWFRGLGDVLVPLSKYILAVVEDGDYLNDWLTHLPEPIQGVVKAIGKVIAWFGNLDDWLSGDAPVAMATFLTTWEVLKATVLAVVDVFKTQVLPPLQAAFDSLTEALAVLGLDWGDVWEAIKKATKIVAITVGAIILALVAVFTGIVTALAKVVAHISGVFVDMTATFRLGMESISRLIGGAMAIIKGIFTGDLELIKAGWLAWVEGLWGIIRAFGQGLKNSFNLIFGSVWAIVSGFCEGVFGFFKSLYDRLVGGSLIQDLMDRLKSIFTAGLDFVVGIFRGWIDTLAESFGNIRDSLELLWHKIVRVKDIFGSMFWVFNEIRHWISVLVEKFNHFKSCLGNFQLPWWLTPGSATPLETGLLGIGEALADVQKLAVGGLDFGGGMALAGAGAGGGGGGITTVNIINRFGPDSVRSDQDILDLADQITDNLELRGIGPVL